MSKLDECIKSTDPALIVFGSPTKEAGKPGSQFRTSRRPNHMGVDIEIVDAPIYSVESGVVWLTLENHKTFGNVVIVRHTEQYYTLYGHLNADGGIQVVKNNCVDKGDQIGLSGNTGRSDGPHLHFEVIKLPPGQEIGQAGVNKKGQPATGLDGKTYRIDPTFIFSAEKLSLLEVDRKVVAKMSILPGAVANAGVLAALGVFFGDVFSLFTTATKIASVAAAGAVTSASTYLGVKAHLTSKERQKLATLRKSLGFLVTPEITAKQLARAEVTGKRSPLQQRKIELQIRGSIAAAHAAANSASSKLSDLNSELADVQREIENVRRITDSTISSAEDAITKREEAGAKLAVLERRREAITKEENTVAEQIRSAGAGANGAGQRFEASVVARERYRREHGDSNSSHSDATADTSQPKITTVEDSTLRTIVLRAGEPEDESVNPGPAGPDANINLRLP